MLRTIVFFYCCIWYQCNILLLIPTLISLSSFHSFLIFPFIVPCWNPCLRYYSRISYYYVPCSYWFVCIWVSCLLNKYLSKYRARTLSGLKLSLFRTLPSINTSCVKGDGGYFSSSIVFATIRQMWQMMCVFLSIQFRSSNLASIEDIFYYTFWSLYKFHSIINYNTSVTAVSF